MVRPLVIGTFIGMTLLVAYGMGMGLRGLCFFGGGLVAGYVVAPILSKWFMSV